MNAVTATEIVILIVGKSGTGKTTLLKKLADKSKGKINFISAITLGVNSICEWDRYDCIAIDDVELLNQEMAPILIEKLERSAIHYNKKLMLVIQSESSINQLGIVLKTRPEIIEINGAFQSVSNRLASMVS